MPTPITMTDALPMVAANGTTGRNDALDIRRGWISALLGPTGNEDFVIRAGVLPRRWTTTGPYAPLTFLSLRPLAQATASRSLDVQKGLAVVYSATGGPYLTYLDSATPVLLDPADPTNPRVDVLYLQLVDNTGQPAAAEHGAYIKVVNGAPAGTPTAPAIPADAVELARVSRPAGTDAIGPNQIQDTRKSAGLYGAVRVLLPGDAVSDPGGYPGEMRYRTAPAGSGLSSVVDRWGHDDQWHGTASFSLTTYTVNTTGYVNQTYGAAMSIAIPDPGYPYRVVANGSLQFALGPGVGVDLVWKVGTATGTQFGGTSYGQTNATAGTQQYYNTAPSGISEVQTGARTILMTFVKIGGPSGNGYNAVASPRSHMSVQVIPA